MPGCVITLTSIGSGGRLTTLTNEGGVFVFPSVAAGSYRLQATKEGFQSHEIESVRVSVGSHSTIDFTLMLGVNTVTAVVSAEGSTSLLEPSSNELGTLIEPVSVQQLPHNGRNYLQLGYLSGAAQNGGTTTSNFLSVQTGHSDRDISIAGTEQDMAGFTVDGISVAGSRLGDASLNISIAAIDQFKVVQGFFLPSAGTDPGVVNVVTKPGTNSWHGEAFEFLRNSRLDARNFFEAEARPGPFRRNQFGGAVGGPLLPNRLFVYAHYEGERQVRSETSGAFAPTQAMFAGDFSEITAPIYDPLTYEASTGKRSAFPGNRIPTERINPMAKSLLAYYLPGSNYYTRPLNVFGQPVGTETSDQFGVRVDANLGKTSLFGRYIWEDFPVVNNGLFPVSGISYLMNTNLVMVQVATTLTGHLVNEFRLGGTRPLLFYTGQREPGLQEGLGFTGTADTSGPPGITLSGIGSFGRSQGMIGNIDNTYQMYDSLSWLHGSHEIRFGGGIQYVRTVQESANFNARGTVVFSNVFAAQLAPDDTGQLVPVPGTGDSFADFLLGMPISGTVTSMPRTHYRWTEFAPYIQDTWKFRPGLTLNLGIGWHLATPPNPSGNDRDYPHAFDFATGRVLYAALGRIDPQVYRMDWNNIAPRAGLAWQPAFDRNMVIRLGAGIYYAPQRPLYQLFSVTAPGVSIVQSIANSQYQPFPTYTLGTNVFPPIAQVPITEEFTENLTGTVFALDQNVRSTYSQQWTIGLQHSLWRNILLEVAYIGSQSRKMPIRRNADDRSVPGSLACSPSALPWPQYSYVYFVGNAGSASYNALTAKFQRQFSGGFSFLANYTWSKALADTMQGGANAPLNQMASCRDCDKGMAGFNIPQRLITAAVWELPVGQGKRYLNGFSTILNQVIQDWTINVITTFSEGNPFTVNAPNNTAAVLTNYRANRVCDGRNGMQNADLRTNGLYWLDPGCFNTPTAGYFGDSGANILTGPGLNNWDVGLEKNFRMHESRRIQFRAELFNAWNHAQFENPDNTVGNVTFGRVTRARRAREVQLGLKVLW